MVKEYGIFFLSRPPKRGVVVLEGRHSRLKALAALSSKEPRLNFPALTGQFTIAFKEPYYW